MQNLSSLASLNYKYKGFILGEVTAELLIHDSLESLKLLAHVDWLHAQVVLQVIRHWQTLAISLHSYTNVGSKLFDTDVSREN